MTKEHQPVLLEETIECLAPRPGQVIVDGTFGLGGHARAIAERLGPNGRLVGIEQDERTLKLYDQKTKNITLVPGNFTDIEKIFTDLGIRKVDGILLDLGISSRQINDPSYGLSWQVDAPLDMRLDGEGETALELIRQLSEKELADVLFQLADERRSRRIAKALKQNWREITTTTDLARIIEQSIGRRGKIHSATKTFMALRMLVNRELENLERILEIAPRCLKIGGRLAIISFHSGEDRTVKQAFKNKEVWQALEKKPIVAGQIERTQNPRSRSAKLRAAIHINFK